MTERILALDVSSKTGWAFYLMDKNYTLVSYGQVPKFSEPEEPYPGSYITWAYQNFGKILDLIEELAPDVLVIEETSGGSKSGMSQKILEFTHFLIGRFIKDTGIKSVYYQTESWRRIVGCKMNDEEKARNKEIKLMKKANPDIKVVKNKNGKRIGKIGRKHVNVRRANELLGEFFSEPLILANEDIADACLLGMAYHMSKVKNE